MMTCLKCQHGIAQKFGKTAANTQRFRCVSCRATFIEPKPLGTHGIGLDDAERIFTLMTEGMSIRAIARVTGVHKTTILRLILTVGAKCTLLFDDRVRNLKPRFVQADELWTFVQKKQKRLTHKDPEDHGDQYVWIALDSETKTILSYFVGKRDGMSAYDFVLDLKYRIANHHTFQITTDGLEGYVPAIEEHFGSDVHFAQLVKNYAKPSTDGPDWPRWTPKTGN